jgi:PAS domain S-box-containing protein
MNTRATNQEGAGVADAAGSPPADWTQLSPDGVAGMLDGLTDGIVVLGPDWRYRYVNEPAAKMLGRPGEELLGQHIWTLFPELVGLPFQLAYEQAVRERRALRFVEYHAPSERWFENRILPQGENLVILFRDYTEEHRAEDELHEFSDRMAEAESIARFGVWKWELATGRVRWSDELHRIYGLPVGEFTGTVDAFMALLHADDRERVGAEIARALETGEPFVFEERIVRADGEERVLLSQGRPLSGPDGAVKAVVGVCHDVTDRTTMERALGASERRIRAIIDNSPSLISVRDLAGNYLMANTEFGRVLGVEQDDVVGQPSIDVFTPEAAQAERANARRAAVEQEPVFDETTILRDGEPRTLATVTFALPDDEGHVRETCTIATDMTERREREIARRQRVSWAEQIGSALAEDRVLAFAQPILDLRSGEHTGNELLVRMVTAGDNAELLAPALFVPAAERYGLIQGLDVRMVEHALALPANYRSSVNMSAVTMGDAGARREIIERLAAAPDAAARVTFEITETAALEYLNAASDFAGEVVALGCRLALDDFGTGFGSFTYLRTLPVSYLKIDVSFVRGLLTTSDDRRIVQSIIGIAGDFGLQTIAEGIEDEATLEQLRDLGVDYGQGYHLGRPAPLGPGPGAPGE